MRPRNVIASVASLALVAVLVAFFMAGCGRTDATNAAAKKPEDAVKPAKSEVESGPVKVAVEVSPSKARLSDQLTLTLTINHEEGVAIEKPAFAGELGKLMIVGDRQRLPKIVDGRETIVQVLTLEPTEPGQLTIDPIAVKFTDHRPNGDGKSHTVETEPVKVEITTTLGGREPSLADVHPPAEPMALPPVGLLQRIRWPWAVLALAALVAAAVILRRFRRRHVPTKAAVAAMLTPGELALLEIDRLVESRLADRDVKQFYVELTGIVRRYIERTTGVRAPEQTTEEFLREISRSRTFVREDCARLGDFLEAADLVKFAAHQPRTEDLDESVRRARAFVGMIKIAGIVPSTNH